MSGNQLAERQFRNANPNATTDLDIGSVSEPTTAGAIP
jgi:hypothetical protein